MFTVPKKQLFIVLQLMGRILALVKTGLAKSLHRGSSRLLRCS